jgi:hypothetical protein
LYRKSIKVILGSFIFNLLLAFGGISAESKENGGKPWLRFSDISLGMSGGLPYLLGDFSNYYQGSYWLLLNAKMPLNFFQKRIFLRADLERFSWRHKMNNEASLNSYGFNLGLGFAFHQQRFLNPFVSLVYSGQYFLTRTNLPLERVSSYKSGAALSIGNSLNLGWGIHLEVEMGYYHFLISGKDFQNITASSGIAFSYADYHYEKATEDIRDRQSKKEKEFREIMDQAEDYLRQNNLEKAGNLFKKALQYEIDRDKINDFLTLIENKKLYNKALAFYQKSEPYQAIILLAQTEDPESGKLLNKIRRELRTKVPSLMAQGINAYKLNRFDDCIQIMNQLLLIIPGEQKADIYLTRARKKKEAYLKLR